MKIIHVVHNFPTGVGGGCEIYVAELARQLQGRGHASYVFSRGQDGTTRDAEAESAFSGVYLTRVPAEVVAGSPARRFLATFNNPGVDSEFRQYLDQIRPDIVHFHNLIGLSGRLPEITYERGIPLAFTLHDFWPMCQRIILQKPDGLNCSGPGSGAKCAFCWKRTDPGIKARVAAWAALPFFLYRTSFHRRALRLASAVLLPSRFMVRHAESFGVLPSRIHVVPYGVRSHPSVQPKIRTEDGVRIGYIGTIRPHKGVHIVAAACRRAGSSKIRFIIWGNPNDRPYVEKIKALLGNVPVEFKGQYGRNDLSAVLAGLDLLVVPSMWAETGPLTVLEALAAGVPVLGSRIGGIEERIRMLGGGLLFEPGAVDELAGQLKSFADGQLVIPPLKSELPGISGNADQVEKIYLQMTASVSAAKSKP